MKAFEINTKLAGNKEGGKIIDFDADCSHCGRPNKYTKHRINDISADCPQYVTCIYCNNEFLIDGLI